MPVFSLTIRTDGAAFDPDPSHELASLLRAVADRVETGRNISQFQTIHDANGNDVGRYAVKGDDYR